jgi:signal transduction histidine kinase
MATVAVPEPEEIRPARKIAALAVGGVFGVAAATATIFELGYAPSDEPDTLSVVRGLVVLSYVAVGMYSSWRSPGSRFGLLLIAVGLLYPVTSLTASHDELPYTVGRVTHAAFIVFLAFVLLCFPRDTLGSLIERRVIGFLSITTGLLWIATLPVVRDLPPAGPLTDCEGSCPDNALRLVTAPHWVSSALRSAITIVTAVGLLAVAAVLIGKARTPVRVRRRLVVPVMCCAVVLAVNYSVFILLREFGPNDPLRGLKVVGGIAALAIPGAMLVGQIRGRFVAATSLNQLILRVRDNPITPARVELLLREALGDRLLQLALWDPTRNGYVDVNQQALDLPTDLEDLRVTALDRQGKPFAALIHDATLDANDSVAQGLASTSLLLLENSQLAEELRASRARIVASAQRERLRLERNLHDGAQQRLFAIQVRLDAAREESSDEQLVVELEKLAADAAAAVSELRELAHGLYPTVLRERGLVEGIRAHVRGAAIPIEEVDRGLGRLPSTVEEALYFFVLEAVQNATKHAGRGASVTITLERTGRDVVVIVADDGRGFDPAVIVQDIGLVNMRDRIGAVGGELEIRSQPGRGTTLRARVPVASLASEEARMQEDPTNLA